MKHYIEEIEIEWMDERGAFFANAEVEAHETDDSFSHEFGIEKRTGIKVDNVTVLDVWLNDDEAPELVDLLEEVEERAAEKFIEEWQDGSYL